MSRRLLPVCLAGVAVVFVALLGVGRLDVSPDCASPCGSGRASLEHRDLHRGDSPACLHADGCGGGAAGASGGHQIAPEAPVAQVLVGLSLILGVVFLAFRDDLSSLDPAGRLFRPPRVAG